jgi:membrane protease subunit (stomatin/prohibitin family)
MMAITREEDDMDNTGREEQSPVIEAPAEEKYPSLANEREMPCPMCGVSMPDLKGGKASICPNCGFKDSCCF